MSVEMDSPDTVVANASRLPFAMPSCPPSASMLRMSEALTGCVLESSSAESRSACSSASEPLTVLVRLW